MNRNIRISLALIILFIASVLFLFVNKLTTPRYLSAPELLLNGYYQFPNPKEFSNFQILTSNNFVLDKAGLEGKWTLIYFGYTRCPSECPIAMSLMKSLYAALDSKGFPLDNKQFLLITIDPENDSADIVDEYAKAFNSSFVGARGDRSTLLSMATQFNVMVIEPPKNQNADHIEHFENHSNNILMVNPKAKYVGFFRPPFDETRLLLTYQSLVAER